MFSAPLPTGAEQAAAEVLRKTEAKLSVKKAVEEAIKKDKAQEEPKPKKPYKDDFDYDRLDALMKRGWRLPAIAAKMDVSIATLRAKLQKLEASA